ncbi:MAG: tetratricopeptide repeat protein [Bryobacteraceae bacterium]|nr:tetratricopeptide repeat protein [Bryobacteraceae bacterium]
MARVHMGQPAQAVAPRQKVIAADRANTNARGLFAQALLEAGRPDAAATHYRRLTALTPKGARAWSGLGRVCGPLTARAFAELKPESAEWRARGSRGDLPRRGAGRVGQRGGRPSVVRHAE